jgi:tyrosine-protein kinase Etk/Wzc
MQSKPVGSTVTLHDYFHVIAKRSRLILFSTLAAASLAVIGTFFLTSVYSATAKVLPPQQDGGLLASIMGQFGSLANLAGDVVGKGSKGEMYAEILMSQAIMDPIIDRFQLMQLYRQDSRQFTYLKLEQNSEISVGKKSGIISITVDDRDPKRAAELANAYVEELEKLLLQLSSTGSGQNRLFLEERLAKAKGDLVKAEEALKLFQSANKAIGLEKQAEASIEGIAQLKAQLASQEVLLATLRRQLTDATPEVKNARESIGNLRGQIARMEGAGAGGAIPSVGSVPALGQQYLRVMREFKTQEALVELLTKQYELAKFSEANDVPTLQVVQKAKAPDRKSKPSKRKQVMLVTLAALFLSTAWAFVLESLERMSAEEKERWRSSARLVPVLNRFL